METVVIVMKSPGLRLVEPKERTKEKRHYYKAYTQENNGARKVELLKNITCSSMQRKKVTSRCTQKVDHLVFHLIFNSKRYFLFNIIICIN